MTGSFDWSPPEVFEEYRLVRRLGRGGMGEVFLARDTVLDRLVAVKFIGGFEPDSRSRERFLIEARAAARLQHPNVVAIYRVGELERRPYLITEFIRGESLHDVPKPIPWKRVLELGIGLARGLAAAHRRGVLHRDIKPANALITENGDVKLLDFGLAKLLDSSVLPEEPPANADGSKASAPVCAVAAEPCPGSPDVNRAAATVQLKIPQEARLAGGDPQPATVAPAPPEPKPAPPVVDQKKARDKHTILFRPPPRAPEGHAQARVNGSPPPMNGSPPPVNGSSPEWEITRAGFVLGTPAYLPPEIWRGEPATRRSDVHALGAVLYELCTGFAPTDGIAFDDLSNFIQTHDIPPLCDIEPSVDPRLGAVVDRCLLRDPAKRFASGDELREALEQLMQPAHADTIPEGNPYRGLAPHEAEHRALFFGRSGEIRSILDRLRAESFVLVAGDSGVGKSSLCRAGVLPLVEEGALEEGRAWSVARIVPGKRPLFALAEALAAILSTPEKALVLLLSTQPSSLGRSLRKHQGTTTGLVLFVDQLEELVTMSAPGEAAIVSETLGHLASGVPGVRLLMTVRGDFLTTIASLPGLGDEVSRALYLLRPMSPERIREAIIGPAQAKGVAFESDTLVDTLVESTAKTEGGLPLLQFALAELWEARGNAQAAITRAALDGIGGVAGALARHADRVVLGMLPAQRAAAQKILIALVTLQGTRTRRTEVELVGVDRSAREALHGLVRGRLLVARDTDEGTVYEIAHEALLKGWDTLRRWLDEHEGSRIIKHRLQTAVGEWERLGRTRDALWGERQLREASGVDSSDLSRREAAFLKASRRAVRSGRFTRTALIAGVPLALVLVYAAIRLDARRDVARRVLIHVKEAEVNLTDAQAKSAKAEDLRRTAYAQFDAAKLAKADATLNLALSLSAEADLAYGRASEALETALIIDGSREDLRGQLADILYNRALGAERDRRSAQRDELLRRLALYDPSGERRRRWDAPAHVTIESTPPGAAVSLERFVSSGQKRRDLVKMGDLGGTPIREREVEQGSYVLGFSAPGRAPVRYPVVLGRAEKVLLDLALPMATDIPEGFIYVPPGRFLFGSASDEDSRRGFYNTVPLHPMQTHAYLIARHETTYAEWIEYLRALLPEDRARRTPRGSGGGDQNAIELKELSSVIWQLSIRPTTQTYTAKSGESLHYTARRHRASQDWLRLPVSGITFEDAQAYTSWLSTTGRVPGARLCHEYEWERAARGADDREYPHGDELDTEDANFDGTYGREPLGFGPDEVGSHPASRSPFGLDDMAGNVWSWVVPAQPKGASMLRGGSYYYGLKTNKVVNREISEPSLRDLTVGVRVCATPVR